MRAMSGIALPTLSCASGMIQKVHAQLGQGKYSIILSFLSLENKKEAKLWVDCNEMQYTTLHDILSLPILSYYVVSQHLCCVLTSCQACCR